MSSRAVRAHEEKYRAERAAAAALERRVLSRYAGVATEDVARVEGVAASTIGTIRHHAGVSIDDGLPTHASWRPQQLTFKELDHLMRANRSAA